METRMQGGSAARSLTRLGDDRHWKVRDVPSLPVPLADDLPLARGFPLSGLPATAPIETREGYVSASQVHAGMSVRCLRGKWQTVRAAVALRHVLLPGDRSPVIIRKMALGSGPHVDLALPADQQVVIDSPRAVQVAGQRQVAVQVGDTRKANTMWMVLDKEVLTGRTDAEGKVLREPVIAGLDARGRRQVTEIVPDMAVVKELQDDNRIVAVKTAQMADYMRYYDVTLMNPKVLVGLFIGAMSTFVFCALTMKAVGRAAKGMVEEVRRQFREKPGIMEGTDTPDYAAPVEISTKAAQREMVLPSLLALSLPIVVGLVLGVSGVMGLLVGGLTTGFCVAVFMANAGGAWDNAKKHIEGGAHGGKGTDAHKAAVVGDTVGDPFKDTSGPSLNILVKLMSMVSVVAAGLIVRYSLEALGIF